MSIEIRNLSFSYRNSKRKVLSGITQSIPNGSFTAIIGPNGSGKTTLLKNINGILKPASGEVLFDGTPSASLSPSEMAKWVAYVPQMTGSGLGSSVMDTVLLGRRPYIRWKLSDEDIEIASSVLLRLGIQDLAQRDFMQLSGGQKQTVLIARALVQTPQVYLFDEPVSFLDVRNQLEIMSIAQELSRSDRKTVIMVVHDLNLALRFADNIIMMKEGRVFAHGPSKEVITEKNIWQVYSAKARICADEYVITSL